MLHLKAFMKFQHLILTSKLLLAGVISKILFLSFAVFLTSPADSSTFENSGYKTGTEDFGEFFSIVQFAELSSEKEVDESSDCRVFGSPQYVLERRKGALTRFVSNTQTTSLNKIRLAVLSVHLPFIIECHQMKVYC